MANKRILDETTASVAASDDYLYIDGQTNGSRKITPENIVLNSTTAQLLTQHIADATQEVGEIEDDITDLRADLGELSNRDTTDKSSIVGASKEVAGGSGSGLTEDIKQALLDCFENVAWINDDGQSYYDALEDALYPTAYLVSIDAVYTQSGTVYETDSLDSLKADLVVTAHMSDGTTQTVTTYTLSGTLATGTSTITVAYGGKTTTFSVVVTALLPSGYTKHDYVESTITTTSAQAQEKMIILQTYDNLNRISIEFPFLTKTVQEGVAIIGGRPTTGSTSSFAFYSSSSGTSGKLGYHLHGKDSDVNIPFAPNTVHNMVYTGETETPSTINLDNTDYSIAWTNDNTINSPLTLFANPAGTATQRISNNIQLGRIYVYNMSGDVINDYVPCVREQDNVIGLYDRINSIFYTTSTASCATIGNSNCIYTVGDWS